MRAAVVEHLPAARIEQQPFAQRQCHVEPGIALFGRVDVGGAPVERRSRYGVLGVGPATDPRARLEQ